MSLIPDEELKRYGSVNLAPMVDFLFLILAIFATLAITRTALFDSEVNLVKVHPVQEKSAQEGFNENYVVNLSVTAEGKYKWITEFNEYLIDSVKGIQQELIQQQNLGLLPKEKEQTKVLLHIDKQAQWEPIAQVIFAVRETGFAIHPVYDLDESTKTE
jgi:biopolymer transport protein ExbD